MLPRLAPCHTNYRSLKNFLICINVCTSSPTRYVGSERSYKSSEENGRMTGDVSVVKLLPTAKPK